MTFSRVFEIYDFQSKIIWKHSYALVMASKLYESFRRKPGWRFTACFEWCDTEKKYRVIYVLVDELEKSAQKTLSSVCWRSILMCRNIWKVILREGLWYIKIFGNLKNLRVTRKNIDFFWKVQIHRELL